MMLKTIHMTLAYITVAGFVIRAIWSFTAQSRLEQSALGSQQDGTDLQPQTRSASHKE